MRTVPLFLVTVLVSRAWGRHSYIKAGRKKAEHWERARSARRVRASRLGTDREHTGNRLVILPSGNAIPTAIRAARDSAPNLERAGSVPRGSCRSGSRVPAASG